MRNTIYAYMFIQECPGVAPTAVREVAVLRELNNIHVIRLLDVYVNPTHLALSLIFEYAEFDLSKILQYHVRALGTLGLLGLFILNACNLVWS